jgi:hypothetical protein
MTSPNDEVYKSLPKSNGVRDGKESRIKVKLHILLQVGIWKRISPPMPRKDSK